MGQTYERTTEKNEDFSGLTVSEVLVHTSSFVVSAVVREEWRGGAAHLKDTRKQTETEVVTQDLLSGTTFPDSL